MVSKPDPRGTDHFKKRAKKRIDDTRLSKAEAKEQLRHDLRDQLGRLSFTVEAYDQDDVSRGDGLVIAMINGEQADHYIYHDIPRLEDRTTDTRDEQRLE